MTINNNYFIVKEFNPIMEWLCDDKEYNEKYKSQFEKYQGKEGKKYIFVNNSYQSSEYSYQELENRIYEFPLPYDITANINSYVGGNKRRKSKKKFLFRKSKTKRMYKKSYKSRKE